MTKKEFILNGNNFKSLSEFYDEVVLVLTDNFERFGRNLDAFNDVLRGGLNKFECDEPIKLTWKNSEKSKRELEDFDTLVKIIKKNKHIEFILS